MTPLKQQLRATMKGWAFLSPWLIGFIMFTLIPIGLSFYYSFCRFSLLRPPLYKGMENYRTLLHDDVFWKAVWNTAIYSIVAIPLGMLAALSVAMLLNSKVRGMSLYRTIVFLPSLVPQVASGMIWLWIFNPDLGLLNNALRAIGIKNPPSWLNDVHWAMPALILMSFWGIGNTVVIYLAGLQDVPRELYEASDIDGASHIRKIWHVTLPVISPVIFFNMIMAIIGSLQMFATPYILNQGGAGPDRSTYFYTMYLYDNAFSYLKMGYASSMAWIQFLAVVALTGLAALTSKHWVHYQGK